MKTDSLTLIVPCYNEASRIQMGVLDRIGNYTKNKPAFKEVFIVDDGSTDESVKIIEKYVAKFPKIKLIKNKHQGKAIAVITGIEKATTDFVMFSDIDLATPLDESEKIIQAFKSGEKVVIGSRAAERKGAPITRKIQAKGFIIIRNVLIGLHGIKDTQCGFKGFERKAALEIIDRMRIFTHDREVQGASVSAAFDLEFLFLARKLGYSIKEIPVQWTHAETKGVSLWKDSIETIRDLMRMRFLELTGKYD